MSSSTGRATAGEGSVLETLGQELIGVISPVSICMFLVVLLITTVSSPSSATTTVTTAATLVYQESPTDTPSQKLEGALLNALVFVIIITVATFLLVLLYYYHFTNFLIHYTRFSSFFVLATMGGSIFLSIIKQFDIPLDSITCIVLLYNFTVLGVISIFSNGVPIIVRQSYMVALGIIVAAWFSQLPEWSTWVLLVALALYDLVAVLVPGGPLNLLVQLASSRDEDLPALVYEARPTTVDRGRGGPGFGALVFGAANDGVRTDSAGGSSSNSVVELQAMSRNDNEDMVINVVEGNPIDDEEEEIIINNEETSPLMAGSNTSSGLMRERRSPTSENRTNNEIVEATEMGSGGGAREEEEGMIEDSYFGGRGIKLGLGDFVFYSVLVGRAARYDLMTVYACYLAIISGLGCTLILLAVARRALPALPISIALGVLFYFLTRLLMEPFVVGTSTNLMMF